jgi:sulfite reductase (ferredoxin)
VQSKNIPTLVDRITQRYVSERNADESFQDYAQRIGKAALREMAQDLTHIPSHFEDPSFYTDWGDAREYTIGDMGVGECAGEVVSPAEFALTASDREVFEAQLLLEKGSYDGAVNRAFSAMIQGASSLLLQSRIAVAPTNEGIVSDFKTHFFDTEIFFDPFRGGSLAQYFFDANAAIASGRVFSQEATHQLIEEAQLFLEGCQSCYTQLISQPV